MLTPVTQRLPDFDQAATDRRFLTELDRLLQTGAFSSYRELALQLDISPGLFAAIEAGRYHCNLKLLYELTRHYPAADLSFILYGAAAGNRPEPTGVPVRERGRRWTNATTK